MQSLLIETPADTAAYMIAGFAVIFGVMLVYVLSLYIRVRNLELDMEALNELVDQGE
jgi:hypothetical protein